MSPGRSQGIGARLLRKEDDRFLMGRGQYVGDFKLPGMQEVAFLRSPLAHASIKGVRVPAKLRDRVFIAEDLGAVAPIRADTALPGFKSSVQPVLARVRCATSASSSPCALRARAPKPRIWPPKSSSSSSPCPP